MHLVYHSMEKKPLPASMPADLVPPNQRSRVPVGGVPVLPVMPTLNTGSSQASVDTSASFPVSSAAPANWSSPPSSVVGQNVSNVQVCMKCMSTNLCHIYSICS